MILTAYNMKTKQKDVPFEGKPTLSRTKNGGYVVKGVDKNGNKMCTMLNKENADKAIKLGLVIEE